MHPAARLGAAAIAIGALAGALGVAGVRKACAARRDWTGSAACGGCHPAELAAWQVTAHARTRDRFVTRPEPRCLGCHATGEAPAGPAIAVEVGCEACHGAGAAYAEADVMRDRPVARALGLTEVSTPKARAAVCAPCHRSATRGAAFERSEMGGGDPAGSAGGAGGKAPRGFDPAAPVHPVVPRP
jgi:hypothetical protein